MTGTTGREQIMQAIRQAVNNPHLLADRQQPWPPFEPQPFTPRTLVSRWKQEFEALTGRVVGPLAPEAALLQATEMILAEPIKKILLWDEPELPVAGLSRQLRHAGVQIYQAGDRVDPQTLAGIPLGVTGARAGLADTGSLVVTGGPGRARSASLLPATHLALLCVSDLYPDLPTWMAQQGGSLLPNTANVVIITGPSRTADIEMNLVIGVHGPREVRVILIDE